MNIYDETENCHGSRLREYPDCFEDCPVPAKCPHVEKPDLPSGGLAEAAQKAGAEVHVVAFENIAKNLGLMPR